MSKIPQVETLLHLQHINARVILKEKITTEEWEKISKRKQAAKVYNYRLSETKKERRNMKKINQVGQCNIYDLILHFSNISLEEVNLIWLTLKGMISTSCLFS